MAEPTRDISVEDFIESFDRRYPACILETPLRDRTTGRNIIWADSEYEALGDGYMGDDEITVENQALRHLWWLAHPGPDWAESRERYDIGTRVRPTGGADMDAQAGMPAGLFERSVGLGDAWEVADAWLEPHGGADEPHAGVARRRGAAVPRPVCGAPRGARDSRERAWRHLGVWRHGTIVRCAVPRAGCPGHGALTVRAPWEVRPGSHLAAPFEARAIAAVMSGATASAAALRPARGARGRRPRGLRGRARHGRPVLARVRGRDAQRLPGRRPPPRHAARPAGGGPGQARRGEVVGRGGAGCPGGPGSAG